MKSAIVSYHRRIPPRLTLQSVITESET